MIQQTLILLAVATVSVTAQDAPTFLAGHDPTPAGMSWQLVDNMSDEFENTQLDLTKWQANPYGNGWTWVGRPPALFQAENVILKDGKMCVTVGKLNTPRKVQGYHFTHKGGIVRSHAAGQPGWYFETRMKANATVMSSTFWLMTKGHRGKKLELDIQECVGRLTDKSESWAKNFDHIFHSNMIHRRTPENPVKKQIQGAIKTPTKNYEQYYIYGAWWKSTDEVQFFLNGKYAYSITPSVTWDVPAYIQMAIETYNWNPIPDDGGLVESGTWEQRTTKYDWVRVWKPKAKN